MTSAQQLDELTDLFKRTWADADARGLAGERTRTALTAVLASLESAQPATTTAPAPDGVRTMHPRKLSMACRHLANGYAWEATHTHGLRGVIGQPGMPNVAYRVQSRVDVVNGNWEDVITITLHGSVLTHPALTSRTPKTREQLMLAAEQLAANESALTYLASVPL